jgi:hypothetical protein
LGEGKIGRFAGDYLVAHIPPQVWIGVGATSPGRIPATSAAVDKPVDDAWLY